MIIPGKLRSSLEALFHFAVGRHTTIPERAVKEQEILHEFGRSAYFDAVLDNLEGDIRKQFRVFVDTDADEAAMECWRDARATQRVIKRLMEAVQAKQRGEEMEAYVGRQTELMKADQERFQTAIDLATTRGSTPTHV